MGAHPQAPLRGALRHRARLLRLPRLRRRHRRVHRRVDAAQGSVCGGCSRRDDDACRLHKSAARDDRCPASLALRSPPRVSRPKPMSSTSRCKCARFRRRCASTELRAECHRADGDARDAAAAARHGEQPQPLPQGALLQELRPHTDHDARPADQEGVRLARQGGRPRELPRTRSRRLVVQTCVQRLHTRTTPRTGCTPGSLGVRESAL
eukprot:7378331-Prymnesium_polylepis.1